MQLKRRFESGEFAILAEIEPPKGVDTSQMLANAKMAKDHVDAFVVAEMSNAVMRMSSSGAAIHEAGGSAQNNHYSNGVAA